MSVSIPPWNDMDKVMREQQIPLFALESQDPIKDFDFLGITIQYEMCYTNILQVLDLARHPAGGIPDRTKEHPYCHWRRSLYLQSGAAGRFL